MTTTQKRHTSAYRSAAKRTTISIPDAYAAIANNTGTVVAIYARISRDRDNDEDGVRRQIAACERLAARLAAEFPGCRVEIYRDNDISAVAEYRPDYARLLGDIAAGRVKILLSWSTSRIYRHTEDERDMQNLMLATGTLLETIKGGRLNYITADGRAHARDEASLNQRERERISENTLASKIDDAEQGKWRGGTVPFGYLRDPANKYSLLIDEAKAAAIREATEAILAGRTLSAVTRTFNARLGLNVRRVNLARTLTRGALAGLSERRGVIVGEALWPGIITREQLDQLRAILADPARKTGPGPARKHLGSGLYRGSTAPITDLSAEEIAALPVVEVRGTRGDNGNPRVASYCVKGVNRHVDPTDRYVRDAISVRLGDPEVVEAALAGLTPATTDQRTELAVLKARKRHLVELAAEGEIETEELLAGTRKLRVKIAALEAELEATTKVSPAASIIGAEEPGAAFAAAEISEQQAVVDALCTVVLLPGRKGRPRGWKPGQPYATTDGIEILWKG